MFFLVAPTISCDLAADFCKHGFIDYPLELHYHLADAMGFRDLVNVTIALGSDPRLTWHLDLYMGRCCARSESAAAGLHAASIYALLAGRVPSASIAALIRALEREGSAVSTMLNVLPLQEAVQRTWKPFWADPATRRKLLASGYHPRECLCANGGHSPLEIAAATGANRLLRQLLRFVDGRQNIFPRQLQYALMFSQAESARLILERAEWVVPIWFNPRIFERSIRLWQSCTYPVFNRDPRSLHYLECGCKPCHRMIHVFGANEDDGGDGHDGDTGESDDGGGNDDGDGDAESYLSFLENLNLVLLVVVNVLGIFGPVATSDGILQWLALLDLLAIYQRQRLHRERRERRRRRRHLQWQPWHGARCKEPGVQWVKRRRVEICELAWGISAADTLLGTVGGLKLE